MVEAVASGLAQGGSVDGYVWDTLALSHPELTAQTRIVNKSPQFGHPPIVANKATSKRDIAAMQRVLLHMAHDTVWPAPIELSQSGWFCSWRESSF